MEEILAAPDDRFQVSLALTTSHLFSRVRVPLLGVKVPLFEMNGRGTAVTVPGGEGHIPMTGCSFFTQEMPCDAT
jgi:hypothetical protein